MPDPSYGGKLIRVNDKWQLQVLVDFDEPSMPGYRATLDKVRYRIYEALAGVEQEYKSPDGSMILVSSVNTFSADTYLFIVEGYVGWPDTTVDKQFFVQAGLKQARQTTSTLGAFTLRFVGDPQTDLRAPGLKLRHRDESTPETERPVDAVPGENAVEVKNLQAMGYYGLILARL